MSFPTNDRIVTNLQILLKEANASREAKDRFRAKAYRNAIKEIKNLTVDLQTGKEAMKLKGVGKKIADKIQEIIDTGELHQVQDLGQEKIEQAMVTAELGKIWGVGPAKASELYEAGVRSTADLQKDLKRKNPKYCNFLTANQLVGLRYHKDLQQRVPRAQVAEISKVVEREINYLQNDLKIKFRVCGSFRRRAETCGDMDILLCEASDKQILKPLVDRLTTKGILIETLGLGPTKYMGITKTSTGTAFRIDMEVIKPEEWPFALLYFTGSGSFNERQRLVAKKMGYSLSEHGLRDVDTGVYVKLNSERDIFHFLDMDYLAPWQRK